MVVVLVQFIWEIIYKKDLYVQELEEKCKKIEERLTQIYEEKQNLRDHSLEKYCALNLLRKDDMEMNIISAIGLLATGIAVMALISQPFLLQWGLNLMLTSLLTLGVIGVDVGIAFGLIKIVKTIFKNIYMQNKEVICEYIKAIQYDQERIFALNREYTKLLEQKRKTILMIKKEREETSILQKALSHSSSLDVDYFLDEQQKRTRRKG